MFAHLRACRGKKRHPVLRDRTPIWILFYKQDQKDVEIAIMNG